MTRYFLFAGETSGDLHGSRLMRSLKHSTDSHFMGVGGPRMRQEGLECFFKMEQFQVMGLSDVLQALPRLCQLFYKVRNTILKAQPDCVILIDYPGFNLRLARALRQKGFKGKLVQYICPSVWAHGQKRIHTLANNYDLVLSIFPFEKDCFAETPLRVTYIGNPLVETVKSHIYHPQWADCLELPLDQPLIALFPGSRQGEIKRHAPKQLQAAALLKQKNPNVRFALSCAQEDFTQELQSFIRQSSLRLQEDLFLVPPHYSYDLMRSCHLALSKSGTVTLELALHHVPTLVHYELTPLNYLFVKYILRLNLPYYCLVNILAQQEIFPEFINRKITAQQLGQELIQLQKDSVHQARIAEACKKLQQELGTQPAHTRAAQAIRELVSC